ncbi:hypothetical protein [uncultured Psychroserpens sp.]|uniref:hypothetical protein n=1 Tax=uncultured Psychroserpens sp. TaxID=255436 RepID=UPI002622888D|nr:hypothetical protein [uncultured Psychroserpens sp.]
MKTLKITFLLLAVLLLTVSGQSSDSVADNSNEPTFKKYNPKDIVGIDKKKKRLESQG